MTRLRWWIGRSGWLSGFIFIFVLIVPGIASAHAYLVKAAPMPGSTVAQMPARIQLWFSDPLEPRFADVFVLSPNGKRLTAGPLTGDPKDVTSLILPVHAGGSGTYVVEWRVVSADGHPVAGNFSFSVGAPSGTAQPNGTVVPALPPAEGISRFIQWAALLILPGLMGFWRLLARRPDLQRMGPATLRRVMGGLALLALVATLIRLPIETYVQANVPWSLALRPDQWLLFLQNSTYGTVFLIQLLILLVLVAAAWWKRTGLSWMAPGWRRDGWLIPAFAPLLAMAFAGHAPDRPNPGLSIVLDMVHLAAASWWVGGLTGVVLWVCTMRGTADPPPGPTAGGSGDWPALVRTVGWGFAVSVVALAVTGIQAAWVMTPTVYSLVHTSWGQALLIKIVFVALMAILAMVHGLPLGRLRLLSAWWIKGTVSAEWVLGIGVAVCVAVLTTSAPAYTDPGPIHQLLSQAAGTVDLQIEPNRAGMNHLTLALSDSQGRPLTGLDSVQVAVSMPDMPDMGVTQVQVHPTAPGHYEASGSFFSMAGPWQVEIHALTHDYHDLQWRTTIPVGQ